MGNTESLEPVACNLCGSSGTRLEFREKYTDGTYSVVRCRRCGLVYVSPRPCRGGAFDEVSIDEEEGVSSTARVRYYRRWLRELAAIRGGGRLLDVGCGTGVFLEVVRGDGIFSAEGLEVTRQFIDHCRRKGLLVHEGGIESDSFPGGEFDIVTMWDVLEHLRDPRGALIKAYALLRSGGLLLVKVPNIRSLNLALARLLLRARGLEMFHRDHPLRHLYHFSPATLKKMVTSAGLRVLRSATEESAFSTLSGNPLRALVKAGLHHCMRLAPLGMNDEVVILAQKF